MLGFAKVFPALLLGLLITTAQGEEGLPTAGSLARKLDAILAAAPAGAQTATWGIRVVDLGTGKAVYDRSAERFFVPASNTKLFSSALVLARLGPDHRFVTRILAATKPDAAGTLRGDLRLCGGGDPHLSGRLVPYEREGAKENPLEAIEALADALVSGGLRRIEGDVVGDDTAYLWEPYSDSWSIGDTPFEYGAPVSALTVNDNVARLRVAPGTAAGQAARFTLHPPLEHLTIHNLVQTIPAAKGARRSITVDRMPGSAEMVVRGTIPAGSEGWSLSFAMDDPARWAARALLDALRRRGVAVTGGAVALHRWSLEEKLEQPPVELARRVSAPLHEALQIVNKESQNLHAEIMLRETARVRRGVGSVKGGLEELKIFLTESGIEPKSYRFEDGSGLSRLTQVTPAVVARLLTVMYRSPQRQSWVEMMPIGGYDGTLRRRFDSDPAAAGIHAKTGTLSNAMALGGYALPPNGGNGRRYAFAILVNNYNSGSAEVRRTVDRIALALLQ